MKDQSTKKEGDVILELSFKFQMKNYKFQLVTKKAWFVALGLLVIRVLGYFLRNSS